MSIRTWASPEGLYLTMFVNSSSSVKSTVGRSPASTPWRAKKSAVNAKISASEPKLRRKLR